MQRRNQAGFTILELTIATAVFSVILLIITAGIVNFTKQYIAGVHRSQTQQTARQVMTELTQGIQFSAVPMVKGGDSVWKSYCFGSVKYSVKPNVMAKNGGGLIRSVTSSTGDCPPTITVNPDDPSTVQLLDPNMRIVLAASDDLVSYDPTTKNSTVKVDILYGDGDATTTHCQGGAGSEYCAHSVLTTTVQRRLGQ